MCDSTVHGLASDQWLVLLGESLKQIKKATEDAVQATIFADSEIDRSQRIWSQLDIHKTARQGSDSEVKFASAAVAKAAAASLTRAAAALTKASFDASLQANAMVDAVMNSSDAISEEEAVSNSTGTGSADVTRENNLNLICKEANLACKKSLSDALAIIATGEPNPLKLAKSVQSGPSDFREELGVTSAIAKPTRTIEVGGVSLVEADASSAKQSTFGSREAEADTKGKGGSRRPNRKIQPTSRLLEGLETSFISRGPSVSLERGKRTQRRTDSSRGTTSGSTGADEDH